jgi:hypothetical protein
MLGDPVFTALTITGDPVDAPNVAIAVLLLLHVPPVVASLRLIVAPWHTDVAPLITPTAPFTVAIAVT